MTTTNGPRTMDLYRVLCEERDVEDGGTRIRIIVDAWSKADAMARVRREYPDLRPLRAEWAA